MNISNNTVPFPHHFWKNPIHFFACGFGLGALPWAPGTFGTLPGVGFYLLFYHLPWFYYLLIIIVFFLAGLLLCDKTNKHLGTIDHPAIVWDEMTAFLLVMFGSSPTWYSLVLGFMFFRLFDIAKPWPIQKIASHPHKGLACMGDDILAACYAWISLHVVVALLQHFHIVTTALR